jgi:hypothetical protein
MAGDLQVLVTGQGVGEPRTMMRNPVWIRRSERRATTFAVVACFGPFRTGLVPGEAPTATGTPPTVHA